MAERLVDEQSAIIYSLLEARSNGPRIPPVATKSDGDGGGGGGAMEDVIRRVGALEKGIEKIDGKLDSILAAVSAGRLENEKRFGLIESRLGAVEIKLDTKASTEAVVKIGADLAQRVQGVEKDLGTRASATDMAGVKGAVEKLPTTLVLIGFVVTVLVAAGFMKHFIP